MTITGLRNCNSYDVSGVFADRSRALDDLIIEHLAMVKEMQKLDAYEETVIRMMVEGYEYGDIAAECNVSVRTVARLISQLRYSLLSIDPRRAA